MSVRPSDLRSLPLFTGITDEHLEQLIGACERRELPAGDVLFEAGTVPNRLIILIRGEVLLREGDQEKFRLKAVAPVGELGALTGLARSTTALTSQPSEVLCMSTEAMLKFFENHGDVAFPFHHNLLNVVADKIRRDARRAQEMRENIIRTQKAMKRMREAVLQGDDSPLNRLIYEELDALIEQNRKGHYLVEPARALPASLRLDDGRLLKVKAMSNEWLHLSADGTDAPEKGADLSGVLVAGTSEIPVSGNVESVGEDTIVVCLDMLIDDYAAALEDHLTRLQMLDVVL